MPSQNTQFNSDWDLNYDNDNVSGSWCGNVVVGGGGNGGDSGGGVAGVTRSPSSLAVTSELGGMEWPKTPVAVTSCVSCHNYTCKTLPTHSTAWTRNWKYRLNHIRIQDSEAKWTTAMILTYWTEERDWWFLQNTQTIPTISHDSPWQGRRTSDSAREVNNIQESCLCNSGQPRGLSGDWLYKGDQVVVMEFLSQLFLPIWTEQSSSLAVHLSAPFYSTEIKSPVNLMPALI